MKPINLNAVLKQNIYTKIEQHVYIHLVKELSDVIYSKTARMRHVLTLALYEQIYSKLKAQLNSDLRDLNETNKFIK